MTNIRDKRQEEAINSYEGGSSLIKMAPRSGKCRVGIGIFRKFNYQKILILAPRTEIFTSWKNEFKITGYDNAQIEFMTFTSLKKVENWEGDLVVIDELQELSSANHQSLKKIKKNNLNFLCLSGTVTKSTQRKIFDSIGAEPCYEYSIAQAVKEGVITDYSIVVHRISLDNSELKYQNKSGKKITEKQRFKNYMYVKDKLESEDKDTFFMDLKLINMLQNSTAKLNKTKELLSRFENERCLVFCGLTDIADDLGIPVYHSKAKEKQIFEDFCQGINHNHLACVKLIQSGITIKPIKYGIMSYLSGAPEDSAQKIARFLAMEYDTPDKKAEIHIVTSNEDFELERLESALMFFDKNKIKYL